MILGYPRETPIWSADLEPGFAQDFEEMICVTCSDDTTMRIWDRGMWDCWSNLSEAWLGDVESRLFESFWLFFQYCGRCISESCVNMCQLTVNSLNKTWSCHVLSRTWWDEHALQYWKGMHLVWHVCAKCSDLSGRAPLPMLCSHAASSLLVLRLQLEAEIGPECFGCLPGSVLVTLISSWDPSEYQRNDTAMIQP